MELRVPGSTEAATTTACTSLAGQVSVEPVYPLNGEDWNDYVKKTNPTTLVSTDNIYNQLDVACAGTENGYFSCIHGGELRKVSLPGVTSCSGFTSAVDDLGAFDWECNASSGTAVIYSRKLKQGKGLRDLLTATAFIQNKVTITHSGICGGSVATDDATWWGNTVSALPTNPNNTDAAIALAAAGTIYTQTGPTTSTGYNLNADKIAIVTLGTAELTYSGRNVRYCDVNGELVAAAGSYVMVCAGSQNFLWVEVKVNGDNTTQATNAVNFRLVNFSRVHLTDVRNCSSAGALYVDTKSTFMDQSNFGNNAGGNGNIILQTSTYNTFSKIKISHSLHGMYVQEGSHSNVFQEVAAYNIGNAGNGEAFIINSNTALVAENTLSLITLFSNQNVGFNFRSTTGGTVVRHTLTHMTSANCGATALSTFGGSSFNVASNIVASNCASNGIGETGGGNTDNDYYDVVATGSGNRGFNITTSANISIFGTLRVGGNTTNCFGPGLPNQLNNACNYGPALAKLADTTVSLASSFVGTVSVTDSNPTNLNGTTAYVPLTMDWFNFSTFFRGWGMDGTLLFTNSDRRGRCTVGNCRIYDVSLDSSDAVLKNHFGAFVVGAACPASVDASDASVVITDRQTTPNVFLKSAFEIISDGYGDEDGLCESSEACIYAPNSGSYQGQGSYLSRTCTFTGGNGVTGVTLYSYETNGGN